ncbi:MAG TPA: hypothetical protein PLW77_03150 [Bacteroidales bacterium]|nr:hypothetical protein [Bacteroidales bacterium]HQB21065.1 hypothetical protein [Bacteroidales bacterium]
MKTLNLKTIVVITVCVLVVFTSCDKNRVNAAKKILNLTALNSDNSTIVSLKFDKDVQKDKQTFSIGCYDISSCTFNKKTNTFGYEDCNNVYKFIDVETFTKVNQFQLPNSDIVNFVVDTIRNLLIGTYFVDDEDPESKDGTDWIVAMDLNSGEIVSNKQFYKNGAWGSTYFFRAVENEYVSLNYTNQLLFVNPTTGNINRTLSLNMSLDNGVYDSKNNRLIGVSYSDETHKNYIVSLDINTGNVLNKNVAQSLNFMLSDVSDYDEELNSYIIVNDQQKVLFFDVETGQIIQEHQLDFDISSIHLWRSSQ